jgi:glycosyltransferase involved in cell wall biosynthesis
MIDKKISVVVTTKNEEKNITNCLQSIRNQTWKNIEIIVVDNDSSDRTKEIASGYTDLVFNRGPERSAQRNYGLIEVATGEFGLFIDADMILAPRLIEFCVQKTDQENLVALHIEEVVLGSGKLARARRFERSFYSGTCIDGVRFFKLEEFREIGGFDESLPPGPEDWDLDKRMKAKGKIDLLPHGETNLHEILFRKETPILANFVGLLHNEEQQSLREYLKKKAYYSPSMSAYQQKWAGDSDLNRQLGFSYRFLVVFIERKGWVKVLQHPLLFMSVLTLRFLVGFVYLRRILRTKIVRAGNVN